MRLQNERTGKDQAVSFGDILYAQLDEKTALDRPKTWSFRCQGFVIKQNERYILGPGDTIFRLGLNCFTTSWEAREYGDKYKTDQFRFVKLTDEERIRV